MNHTSSSMWNVGRIMMGVLVGSGLWASAVRAQAPEPRASRPNIILIYTDDQDWDEVGCYGGNVQTPFMDSLARDGMRFTRFYVSAPVCTPSRYNLIAGRYASRSKRVLETFPAGGPVNLGWESGVVGEKIFPQVLQEHGYVTGMVGKWHIGLPEEPAKLPIDADPRDPDVKKVLEANYQYVVRSIQKFGFDYVASVYGLNPGSGRNPPPTFWLPKALQQHNQEWLTEGALRFIEQNKDRPFFLYMATTLPHAPPALKSLKSDPRISARGLLDRPPEVHPSRREILERVKGMDTKQAGAVWLDANIGAILKKLDALGLTDKTAVFLASDNGRWGKFTCYDGGARTILLARWPGHIPAGTVCDKLVSNIDLAPTILEMCGIEKPADLQLDGKSILPVLEGREDDYRRESLFLEITTERAVVTDDGFKYIAVRYPPEIQELVNQGKRFNHWCQPMEKSTHTMGADKLYPHYFEQDQLYDLKADPKEQKNLIGDPAYRKRLAAMRQLLREYSARLPHTFGEFTGPPAARTAASVSDSRAPARF